MRETMMEMMSELAVAIVATTRMADDLAEAADKLCGDPIADSLHGLARRHRVEVMQLQGRLAGLTNDFVDRFGAM